MHRGLILNAVFPCVLFSFLFCCREKREGGQETEYNEMTKLVTQFIFCLV
jgi:hypothetical protein